MSCSLIYDFEMLQVNYYVIERTNGPDVCIPDTFR